jgi:hypothetical protein
MITISPLPPLENTRVRWASLFVVVLAGCIVASSVVAKEAAPATQTWASGLKNLTPQQGLTLLLLARDLFPNPELADSNYTVCVDPYDVAASDAQAKAEMEDAFKSVEGASRRMANTAYIDISDDAERVRLAKMLADGRWVRGFKKSVGACLDAQRK